MKNTRDVAAAAAVVSMALTFFGVTHEWSSVPFLAIGAIVSFLVMVVAHFWTVWNASSDSVHPLDVVRIVKTRKINILGIGIASTVFSLAYDGSFAGHVVVFVIAYLIIFFAWAASVSAYLAVRSMLNPDIVKGLKHDKMSSSELDVEDHFIGWIFVIEIVVWILVAIGLFFK